MRRTVVRGGEEERRSGEADAPEMEATTASAGETGTMVAAVSRCRRASWSSIRAATPEVLIRDAQQGAGEAFTEVPVWGMPS